MKSAIALMLLIAVTAVTAQNGNETTAAQTTAAPTTAAPTHPTTTTMTPTTAEPTTTTKEPTTTADQTTTHTAEVTTATTTHKPATTTTHKPDNHTVDLNVRDGATVCILFKSEVEMTFSYKDDNDTANEMSMYLPTSATAKGNCNGTQTMTIMYGTNNVNMLTLTFGQDKESTFIQSINLTFTMDSHFPGINTTRSNLAISSNKQVFKGSSGLPYMCKSPINMTLDGAEERPSLSLVLTTKNLEYEAYRKKNDTIFGEKYVNCPEDSVTSNIVPIAVGAALAALVVIVLIAYLISRNRTKRGYESV